METTITIKEMEFVIKDFLKENYNITKMPKFCFNGRLGRRTVGQYWATGKKANTIELAKKFEDIEGAIGTLLHEVVHYALHILKREWHDGEFEFEKELVKFDLPTNYRRDYFRRKFNVLYGEMQTKYFEKEVVEYYTDIILAERGEEVPKRVDENVVMLPIPSRVKAAEKAAAAAKTKEQEKPKAKVKLEKTKISKTLHEIKKANYAKGSKEWKMLTEIINNIRKTPTQNTKRLLGLYEIFLYNYICSRNKGTFDMRNKGFEDVILLINSKVNDKYTNDWIAEFKGMGVL